MMYDYFKGILAEKNTHYAVVEACGIGYKLNIPSSVYHTLPPVSHQVMLYASWVVRETSQTLYGFSSQDERDLFELLLTVSGIGPKTALGIVGTFDPHALQDVVRKENVAALAQVPGIGKKTAEKLIVDLKGKLKLTAMPKGIFSAKSQDAFSALLKLGYSQSSADRAVQKALEECSEEGDLPSIITAALKHPRN